MKMHGAWFSMARIGTYRQRQSFLSCNKNTKSKLRNTPFIPYADKGICKFTNDNNEIVRNEGKSYKNTSKLFLLQTTIVACC